MSDEPFAANRTARSRANGSSLAQRLLAVIESDPTSFTASQRDGRGHVTSVTLANAFIRRLELYDIRRALFAQPKNARRVWLATECGVLEDGMWVDGRLRYIWKVSEPLTVTDCMDYYGFSRQTVYAYRSRVNRALADRLRVTA